MKTFAQFVEDKGMEGMSVKGGHKRTVKQGAVNQEGCREVSPTEPRL